MNEIKFNLLLAFLYVNRTERSFNSGWMGTYHSFFVGYKQITN